jgi:hypothetical protein
MSRQKKARSKPREQSSRDHRRNRHDMLIEQVTQEINDIGCGRVTPRVHVVEQDDSPTK